MDNLKTTLNLYSEVSEEGWNELYPQLVEKKLKSKSFYIKAGQVCSRIGFIKSGFCRAYYEGKSEDPKTVYFNFVERNPIVSDFESFITKKPSLFTIQAITDCDIVSIDRSNLYRLYDKHPSIKRLGRVLAEKHYLDSLERIRNSHADATTQYKLLVDKYPELILNVPAYMIASYLDITEFSLSRIKKEISTFPKKLS